MNILAFIFLSALLLWLLIGSKGAWWVKLGAMLLTLAISMWMWKYSEDLTGFPKNTTIAELHQQQALLFWVRVDEPNSISLWMRLDKGSPRVFKFPYSRELHETAVTFLKEILKRNGEPILITFYQPPDRKGKGQPHQGAGGEESDNRGSMSRQGIGMVYQLPDPKLPEK